MSDHEWCRDTARDEAVRAAEDAAAVPSIQHRDLPEVVAALAERVAELTTKHNALADLARLDAGWLKANEQRLAAERDAARARVAELEAAAPPRGWLTAEEREAVRGCLRLVRQEISLLERYQPDHRWLDHWRRTDAALSGLLARAAGGEVEG